MGILDKICRNSLTFVVVACTVLVTVSHAAPYSKYGRGCQDIGCLPSEVCVMSQDSCSFGQRDGKDCGSYPTCKKSSAAGSSQNNRGQGDPYDIATSRPATPPTTPRPSAPAFPTYDNRDRVTPTRPPAYPSYPGNSGGGGGYGGNSGFGGNSGGGGYVPPGYDPSRDRPASRPGTTKRPGGGFFDSIQDRLGQEIGNYVKNAIFNQIVGGGGQAGQGGGGGTSTRFGGSGGGGSSGFGSLFGGGGGSSGGGSGGFGSLFGGGGGGGSSSSGGSGGLSSLLFGGGGGGESQRRSGFGLFSENPSAGGGGQAVAQNRQQSHAAPQQQHYAGDSTQKTTPKYGWNV